MSRATDKPSISGQVLFAVSAAWVQTVAAVAVNMVQLPLFFHFLARDALGAWMLFSSIGLFLMLWDLGLGVTFARSVAYFRGAREATGEAAPVDMLRTVSLAYWALAAALYAVALVAGRLYLAGLEFSATSLHPVWVAWMIYAGGCAVNLGANSPLQCLNGMGDVGVERSLRTVFQVLGLAANVAVLWLGLGIVALSVVFVGRAAGLWCCAWLALRRRHRWVTTRRGAFSWRCLRALGGDCARIFTTRFGAFLILQTPPLVIARCLGPARVPDFMALWMVLQLGMAGAMAVGQAVVPHAAAAHAAADRPRLLRLHAAVLRAALTFIGLWCVGLAVWAPEGVALWLGRGRFLGYAVLAPMLITAFLEVHHSVNANFIWSTGRWPFAPFAIAAGVINLGLGVWWTLRAGEAGMAWATCVAQLLTNNWFAVYTALRVLKMSANRYLRTVAPTVAPVLAAAAVALGVRFAVLRWAELPGNVRGVPTAAVVSLVAGATAAVVCAAALFWRLGVDDEMRAALRLHAHRLTAGKT